MSSVEEMVSNRAAFVVGVSSLKDPPSLRDLFEFAPSPFVEAARGDCASESSDGALERVESESESESELAST